MTSKAQKLLIRDVEVIEPPVKEQIAINRGTMLCEPVENLDELLFWEEKLDSYKRDYLIAEFTYDVENETGKSTAKRVFGIFTNMTVWADQAIQRDASALSESGAPLSTYFNSTAIRELAERFGVFDDNYLSDELNREAAE